MSDRFQTFSRQSYEGDPQRETESGRQVRVNRRRDEFLAGLPVQESESVQTGPGMGEYRSRRICGRELILLSYSFAPKMVIHTVPERDWAILLMSLEPQADVVYNGVVARPGDLFLCMGHDGYMSAGKNRRTIAIGVPKARLVSACAALAGVGDERVALDDCVLPREQVLGQQVHRTLIEVAAQPGGELLCEGQFAMAEALENDLTSILAARLLPAIRQGSEVKSRRVDALRVVHDAIAASEVLAAPSLADLCAAAGVSQRWLHKCFVDVIGVSPHRYIKAARLSKARAALLAPEDRPPRIKSLALSLGYRLSGRFAADYRALFGENPSETFATSCKD